MNSNQFKTDFARYLSVPDCVYLAVSHSVQNIQGLMLICDKWNDLDRDGGVVSSDHLNEVQTIVMIFQLVNS